MTSSRELRKRTTAIDYKEPRESDIPGVRSKRSNTSDELFPIAVVDEDSTRYKVIMLATAVFMTNGKPNLMLLIWTMVMETFLIVVNLNIDFLSTTNWLHE